MSPLLLVPILAQTITLRVSDRTEGRYLVQQNDTRWEGATTPNAALSIVGRRSNLGLFYGTSFLLSPLDRSPRGLSIFHTAGVQTGYRFKHTSVFLSSGLSFGELNLQTAALQAPALTNTTPNQNAPGTPSNGQPTPNQPTTPTPTPTPGSGTATPTTPNQTPQQPQVLNRTVRYLAWTTTAGATHRLTRELSVSGSLGYSDTGGLGSDANGANLRIRGWLATANAAHNYVLSRTDAFNTSIGTQRVWSDNGNTVTSANATESWRHVYSPRTSSDVGGGLNASSFERSDGLVAVSIFPTFFAGVSYARVLARGGLAMSLRAFSAPALDAVRATVDPRVGSSAGLVWSRDRLTASLSATAGLSIARPGNNDGAIDSASGGAILAYSTGDFVTFDLGVRANVQRFKDITVIPPSYAAFAGVSLGYLIKLKGK